MEQESKDTQYSYKRWKSKGSEVERMALDRWWGQEQGTGKLNEVGCVCEKPEGW